MEEQYLTVSNSQLKSVNLPKTWNPMKSLVMSLMEIQSNESICLIGIKEEKI